MGKFLVDLHGSHSGMLLSLIHIWYYQSEVFKWGYNWADRTPWNNVKRIMPNTVYSLDDMKVKPTIIRRDRCV